MFLSIVWLPLACLAASVSGRLPRAEPVCQPEGPGHREVAALHAARAAAAVHWNGPCGLQRPHLTGQAGAFVRSRWEVLCMCTSACVFVLDPSLILHTHFCARTLLQQCPCCC